jgi:hypothetical protein
MPTHGMLLPKIWMHRKIFQQQKPYGNRLNINRGEERHMRNVTSSIEFNQHPLKAFEEGAKEKMR